MMEAELKETSHAPKALLDSVETLKTEAAAAATPEPEAPPATPAPATPVPDATPPPETPPVTPEPSAAVGSVMDAARGVSPEAPASKGIEHKFDVLKGKYDAETAVFRKEAQAANAELASLKGERERLLSENAMLEARAQAPLTPAQIQERYGLSEGEVDCLEPGALNVIHRIATAKAIENEERQEKRFSAETDATRKILSDHGSDLFKAETISLEPEALGLDHDPEFRAYITDSAVPSRFETFCFACDNRDAKTTADFFTQFIKQRGPKPSKPSIESQETPPSVAGPVAHGGDKPKQHTAAQVEAMFSDFVRNRGSMSHEQRQQAKKELDAASKTLKRIPTPEK